jgi:hypothetical protein
VSLLEQYRTCLDNMGLIMAGYDLPVEDTVQQLLKCVSDERLFQQYLAEVRLYPLLPAPGLDAPLL